MKILLSLFAFILTFNSCDSSKNVIKQRNIIQETLSGTYAITQLAKEDVISTKITISFDESTNKVTGFAGCNSFSGNYTLENDRVKFHNIAASKKFCPNPIMTFENQILKSLNSVDSFSKRGNIISFLSKDVVLIKGISKVVSSEKSELDNYSNQLSVKYQALSRAEFDYIVITESNILISKDRDLKNINSYTIDTNLWNEVYQLIKRLDFEMMQDLDAPSKKHQFDGAAYATLSITQGDMEYTTPAFDHGNPPSAIEALVNKVLSIKENTIKQ
ncbi:META domain-containing protein [Winogradskyella bathintestinalis]|uniref:META domain-containing protein n=1 Tax=Winogradskyella bathintestinalis TaxID=3035208 RepID=A0ABT7ZQX7_9FLAO|nr:META domain-containing protein [Winogradskyella bathintestinalis]MDN3491425.1 META domain-containing protein [Winogradskyella bathintestinalis]